MSHRNLNHANTRPDRRAALRRAAAAFVVAGVLLIGAASAFAQYTFSYQGVLTDETGAPLAGPRELEFKLHEMDDGEDFYWHEIHTVTVDEQGGFSVILGSGNNLLDLYNRYLVEQFWLSVTIEGVELSPRHQLAGSVTACLAAEAMTLEGHAAADFAAADHQHDERYYTEDELTISDGDDPNTGSNLVHWDNLVGVPAGFADGVDHMGESTAANTLDGAYDEGGAGAGRTITADAGEVRIEGLGGLYVQDHLQVGPIAGYTSEFELLGNTSGDAFLGLYANNTYGGYLLGLNPDSLLLYKIGKASGGGGDLWLTDGSLNENLTAILSGNDGNDSGLLELQGEEAIIQLRTDRTGDDSVYLPDRSINSTEMLNETGISRTANYEYVPLPFNQTTMIDIVTTTLTTPHQGIVYVTATGVADFDNVVGPAYVLAQIDTAAGGNAHDHVRTFGTNPSTAGADVHQSVHVEQAYYLPAGTYTFRLEVMTPDPSGGAMYLADPAVTALYLPTIYGGVLDRGTGSPAVDPLDKTVAPTVERDLRDLELDALRERAEYEAAQRRLAEARLREMRNRN